MHSNYNDFGIMRFFFGFPFGLLINLAILLIIGLIIYKLFTNKTTRRTDETSQALKILNERFAQGEISETEYEDIRDRITRK